MHTISYAFLHRKQQKKKTKKKKKQATPPNKIGIDMNDDEIMIAPATNGLCVSLNSFRIW